MCCEMESGMRSAGFAARRPAKACATLAALALSIAACKGSNQPASPTAPTSPPLSYLSLFPERQAAVVGGDLIVTVTARDTAGAEVGGVVPVYTSSNPALVELHPDGRVRFRGVGTITLYATAGGQTAQTIVHIGSDTYDLAQGPPRVLSANYIDLSKIGRVSRFRSAIGHHYAFNGEPCRSMKHYFEPKKAIDWRSVEIYAPATGTITGPGDPMGFRPRDLPALSLKLFHVAADPGIVRGTWVEAGQRIGHHAYAGTMSDIAMSIGALEEGRLLSYFETMTDAVFAEYQARGVPSRQAAIITREERDADPVPCENQSAFTAPGTIPNWLVLN
jgi:hypothetical protein